MLFNINMVLST